MKLPELEIGIRIQRKDGTVEEYWEPGHSWTRQAWNRHALVLTDMTGSGGTTVVAGEMSAYFVINNSGVASATNNTFYRRLAVTGVYFSADAGIARGLVVGSGNAAFDFDRCGTTGKHNTMDAQIEHGTGTDQLEYAASQYPSLAFVLGSWRAEWSRVFTNASGADITIREVGLRSYDTGIFSSNAHQHIMARDVLAAAITLANTETATFKYRMSMSFAGLGSDAWTRNAWNWLFANAVDGTGDGEALFGNGYMSVKRTSGTIDSSSTGFANKGDHAGYANNTAKGMVVGTDATAMTVDDYALGAQIAHGTGAGQLSYGANALPSKAYATKKWTATHSRTFTNNSAGDITVREIGMIYSARIFTGAVTNQDYLFYRKVLDTPVTIVPTASHTFEIEMTVDFGDVD